MKVDLSSHFEERAQGHPSSTTEVAYLPSLPLENWAATKDTLHLWIQIVGKIKLAYVPPRNHWWHDEDIRAIGYPAAPNPPFNGQRMHFCDSTIEIFDPNFPVPHPIGMGCDMEGGSSGGGWIHDGDTVVSNVSYGYPNDPTLEDVFFGPQLTNTAEAVCDAASAVDTQPPRITRVSDGPDPFTPNGDGNKDVTRIRFTVNEDFDLLFTIKKGGNNAVRLVTNNLGAGPYVFTWNGRKNNSGKKVKGGKYTYSIKATDDDGNPATKSGKTTVRR